MQWIQKPANGEIFETLVAGDIGCNTGSVC